MIFHFLKNLIYHNGEQQRLTIHPCGIPLSTLYHSLIDPFVFTSIVLSDRNSLTHVCTLPLLLTCYNLIKRPFFHIMSYALSISKKTATTDSAGFNWFYWGHQVDTLLYQCFDDWPTTPLRGTSALCYYC